METKQLKVFIVDDHAGTREGLRKLLEFEKDFVVCGEADTFERGLTGILHKQPDVAVIDVKLGNQSGLALVDKLNGAFRKIPILMLSMHSETVYAEQSLRHGARGYLMKSESPDQILFALRQVAHGNIYVSPTMTKKLRPQGAASHE